MGSQRYGSTDPLDTLYGNPFPNKQDTFIRGAIVSVSANKCNVLCEDGSSFYNLDWPNADVSPTGAGCKIEPPQVGTGVIIRRSATTVQIAQTFVAMPAKSDRASTFSVSDSGTLPPGGVMGDNGSMFRGTLPDDTVPGDRVTMGNQGQKYGLLEGGTAFIAASPWSAVRCLVQDDTVQILGRNLQIETGFGSLRFIDSGGKVGLDFEGGTDKLTETGTGSWNPTVRFRIGNTAAGLMDMLFTSNTGDTLYSSSIATTGERAEYTAGGLSTRTDGQLNIFAGAGRYSVINQGAEVIQVKNGDMTTDVAGSYLVDANQAISLFAGSNVSVQSMRDVSFSAGTKFAVSVGPGNPLGGQIALMNHDPNPLACIDLQTAGPLNSVKLGSIFGIAPFHAAKFEMLAAFLSALITYLDTHTHGTGVGPSSPPIIPSSPILTGLVQPIMSLKVAIGM